MNSINTFSQMIKTMARAEKRLYYRDQTPESLAALVQLVDQYKPTKIIELGTLSGMSLRAWLQSNSNAEIIAIDLNFKYLYRSQNILPVDLFRVRLIEKNIMHVDFRQLWNQTDKIILYIDAHDTPDSLIMPYLLNTVVPHLPEGSIVAIDDLWYSEQELSENNALAFFDQIVIPQFDPIIYRKLYFSPYWKKGSYVGFQEVIPLMEWSYRNAINLRTKQMIKMVYFQWPYDRGTLNPSFNEHEFMKKTGRVGRNPVDCFDNIPKTQIIEKAFIECQKGVKQFSLDQFANSFECFKRAKQLNPTMPGISYALAICLLRLGYFQNAIQMLNDELSLVNSNTKARNLLQDILSWLRDA